MANVRSRKKKNGRNVAIAVILIIILIIVIVALSMYATIRRDINGSKNDGENYLLVVDISDFQAQIAQKLEDNGIVVKASIWSNWMDKNYPDFIYYNGEYNMNSSMSYEEIAEKLQNPDVSHKLVSITIPEGYNVFDIASRLEKYNICDADAFYEAVSTTDYDYDFLSDLPDDDNIGFILEGFLFPATYDFGENSDATAVVDKMLKAFEEHYTDAIKEFCIDNDMTLYEFLTLASIVQEEALDYSSAADIASVLINRLESGTKLQCDVTYYYAKNLLDYGFSQDVYDSYYTYRCPALPAGPITNCGEEIMNAVIDHSDTDYMFFFSDLNGEFHFSSTGEEFEEQKQLYPWQ